MKQTTPPRHYKTSERLVAAHILIALFEKKVSLAQAFQTTVNLSSLSKALCFGVCRHYYQLSAIANTLMSKPSKSIEVRVALLIGLYQLQYMAQPTYAAVMETVNLLPALKVVWAKGLVNAVLRRFCREKDFILNKIPQDLPYQYDHPTWLIQRIQTDWPQHWPNILMANNAHPPMSLRVNLRKISRRNYLEKLQAAGFQAKPQAYSEAGITLEQACLASDLPGFSEGEISLQDEAAQRVMPLLQLQDGLRVLDACAAPGGKTCHMLETYDLAECLALDNDAHRLQRIQENLMRLGLKASLITGDARQPDIWWDGRLFDRILLDAPCSATGVIRRHPDIKLLRTAKEIQQVAALQYEILLALWPLLKAGGLFVYATCSILKQENEQQIAKFLSQYSDGKLVPQTLSGAHAMDHGWQVLPGEQQQDGFFYSVLCKTEPAS